MSETVNTNTQGKLSHRVKIGYGATYGGLVMLSLTFAVNLMYFYTDVLGIAAATAGTIFLVARLWDVINDPIMGTIVDRTNTRHGRFRPYLIIGGVPLAILSVLCFTAPPLSGTALIVYVLVTYILWGMAYTALNIPYSAMVSVLSKDPQERASISSIMVSASVVGMAITSFATIPMVKIIGRGDDAYGFRIILTIYGALALSAFLISFFTVKEKTAVEEKKTQKYSLREVIDLFTKNRPLVCMIAATLFMFLSVYLSNASAIYFFKYRLDNITLVALFMGLATVAMFFGTLMAPILSAKIGKRKTYMLGVAVSVIATVGMYVFRLSNLPAFFVCAMIGSIGFALPFSMMYGLVADTIEYGEYTTGIRAEGLVYSSISFVNKLAAGLVGVFTGLALTWLGYVPNTVQTSRVLIGIDVLYFGIPFGLGALMILSVFFYPLDKEAFNRIVGELEARKQNRTPADATSDGESEVIADGE